MIDGNKEESPMVIGRREFKAGLLTVLIAVAWCLQGKSVAAAERETLVVAGGCFWCVEADFEKVPGVIGAESGFAGGKVANPTYKQVTRGGTGHLEAVQIIFDPSQVTREKLLYLFLRSVDPTDAGGQFCDRGESYTTAIFVSDLAEKAIAEAALTKATQDIGQKLVTPVRPLERFWPAEAYHQDYHKSRDIVLTRFGPRQKATAYKLYREACGRDARVRALWGADAPFAGQS